MKLKETIPATPYPMKVALASPGRSFTPVRSDDDDSIHGNPVYRVVTVVEKGRKRRALLEMDTFHVVFPSKKTQKTMVILLNM